MFSQAWVVLDRSLGTVPMDEALMCFERDMHNSICDGDRKLATSWLAERIADPVQAEQLRRDWMAQNFQPYKTWKRFFK